VTPLHEEKLRELLHASAVKKSICSKRVFEVVRACGVGRALQFSPLYNLGMTPDSPALSRISIIVSCLGRERQVIVRSAPPPPRRILVHIHVAAAAVETVGNRFALDEQPL
jgi:hypothetical protein